MFLDDDPSHATRFGVRRKSRSEVRPAVNQTTTGVVHFDRIYHRAGTWRSSSGKDRCLLLW